MEAVSVRAIRGAIAIAPSVAVCAVIAFAVADVESAVAGPEPVDFRRDIRPILSDNCFACHGPDHRERKAKLRLDLHEGALATREGKRAAVVPGKPEESELFLRIAAKDVEDRMPPVESGKSLSAQQVELIRRWIAEGATWQDHWAFVAPRRPETPSVSDRARLRSPIDAFVAARLEREGITPANEADRHTLIRRVTFDLTGLPPELDEVRAFVADTNPDAYERLVDRLLASPRFGEHMARFWLDAARYGDTHGLHLDNLRIMWPYRDWVIDAYNRGISFDRFAIEQLAGDLLPEPTLEQRIATGFNRCNVTTSEGGAIAEEWLVRYAVDRVETTSTVFMGLTAGCAVCHEHKFDPISQREFYRLFAFFNNVAEPAMDGNKPQVPPIVEVYLPGVEEELAKLDERIAGVEAERVARASEKRDAFEAWVRESEQRELKREPPPGLVAHFPLDGEGAGSIEGKVGRAVLVDASPVDLGAAGDFEADRAFSYGAWIRTPGNVTGAPIAKMDGKNAHRGWDLYVVGRKVAMHLIHRWSDVAIKATTKDDALEPNRWHHVFVTYDGSRKAGGVRVYVDGASRQLEVNNDSLGGETTRTGVPLLVGQRSGNDSVFRGGAVDDVRIYDRALTVAEVATLAGSDPIAEILATPSEKRSEEQLATLRDHYLKGSDPEYRALTEGLASLRAERDALSRQTATTLVMGERAERRPAHVLERGQYDQPREEVTPGTPAMLPPMPQDAPPNRLGLARWLVDPSHPLTARVAVNGFWHQKFGVGLVKTLEDFGSQGEPPSHPELLDWLATELVRTGWEVKLMQRLLVTSATYRQSARVTPELSRRDPANRLLARGPRYRLDAEMLRDQALALSGLLVDTIGGPSVKPPQPPGLWYAVAYTSSNTARFEQDDGSKIYRRSVYTFWKRTAPPPMMGTLDAPSREACTVRRERTNTPLQALLMMNDTQYVEAARHLAQRVLRLPATTARERASVMFEIATARPPGERDLEDLLATLEGSLAEFREDAEAARALISVGDSKPDPALDPVELAAWTVVGNLILNLDEVINKS